MWLLLEKLDLSGHIHTIIRIHNNRRPVLRASTDQSIQVYRCEYPLLVSPRTVGSLLLVMFLLLVLFSLVVLVPVFVVPPLPLLLVVPPRRIGLARAARGLLALQARIDYTHGGGDRVGT